jgi:Tol biopolymer transport system component
MALSPGTRLGAYDIVALIGAGGMGEVYRARDSRLNRDVALKVLPDAFASDPDRLARFKREAQVLASLNHPNIAAIYGFEEGALVLELVEGPTLADRITEGALPLDVALPIARQIAEAVEAAHEHGVIHRDLKPANIKLRPDGTVKVLDFGLAKAMDPDVVGAGFSHPDATASPTITSPAATRIGMILGTAAYMSPEQARGKPVDKRSDIWAFGCVLYEMLTGRRAFGGDEITDTLALIITKEVDWTALPRSTPSSIHRLLHRCLEKDRRKRLADIADARFDLDDATTGALLAPAGGDGVHRWTRTWMAVALAALVACVALGFIAYRGGAANPMPVRLTITAPPGTTAIGLMIRVSPDGRHVAFVGTGTDTRTRVWVRSLDAASARVLAGSEGASYPFWSADSRRIGFFAEGRLKTIEADGGPVVTVAEGLVSPGGASWNRDDVIVFSAADRLHRVSAGGGAVTRLPIASTDPESGRLALPVFLPDGDHFLYVDSVDSAGQDGGRIHVGSLASAATKFLVPSTANAWHAGDHLFFLRGGTLFAQSFDDRTLSVTGAPVPIADDVPWATAPRRGAMSVSDSVLVYGSGAGRLPSQLVWFDRTGARLGVLGDQADQAYITLNPQGTLATTSILDDAQGTYDIWVYDTARGVRTRLTSDPANDQLVAWSPDGRQIVFSSFRGNTFGLYLSTPSGAGNEQLLVTEGSFQKFPQSWSPDGRFLLYGSNTNTPDVGADLWLLPMTGDRKPLPFLSTRFQEYLGLFSPDGRWVMYQSNESGRYEIYVTSFPDPANKWRISLDGGTFPRWRADGREVFFLGSDNRLMAAEVDGNGASFTVGPVRALFETHARANWPYVVTPDGQRFLVNTFEESGAMVVNVTVNWRQSLRQ